MDTEKTRVRFLNKDDFFEVCAMLRKMGLMAEGADVKHCTLYFYHHPPFDKEKYFKSLDRYVQGECGKLMGDWGYKRKKP